MCRAIKVSALRSGFFVIKKSFSRRFSIIGCNTVFAVRRFYPKTGIPPLCCLLLSGLNLSSLIFDREFGDVPDGIL